KAMSKNPADRYQKARELALALREAVGLTPGEEHRPLTIVAPRPEIQEIDHATGRFPAKQTPPNVAGATISAPQNIATAIEPAPIKKTPLLIGAMLLLLIILGGIAAGAFVFSRGRASTEATPQNTASDQTTSTAVAGVQATETAAAMVNATGTALAEATEAAFVSGPTQTAQAATMVAEATVAQQTREAEIIAGILSAQAGTATAVALEVAATATAAQQVSATQTALAQATAQAAEAQVAAER